MWPPKYARISKRESVNMASGVTDNMSAQGVGAAKARPRVPAVKNQSAAPVRSDTSRVLATLAPIPSTSTLTDAFLVSVVSPLSSRFSASVDEDVVSLPPRGPVVLGDSTRHHPTWENGETPGGVSDGEGRPPGVDLGIVRCLKVPYWDTMLPRVVDDESLVFELLNGLNNGVRIGRLPAAGITVSDNWPSSMELAPQVNVVIQDDLLKGRLFGPFEVPPYSDYIVSPLGAFLKRGSNKARVIHDLSYPALGSVNGGIDPLEFSLQYSSVDDAVALCRSLGPGKAVMAKLDLKDAFKHIPIHPADWHMMGFAWPNSDGCKLYYFSKVLSFGLRSAPALFDRYASWLPQFYHCEGGVAPLVRYVDDFLIVSDSEEHCKSDLDTLITTCHNAGFAVQASKVLGPCRNVEFLGIEIDADNSILRISDDRLSEISTLLSEWEGRTSCSKRQLLKLVGKLAFAGRVVRKGRAFLGRLIALSKKLRHLHFRTKISADAKRDIAWWRESIATHNATYMFAPDWAGRQVHHAYTDASNYGYGASWDNDWFAIAYVGSNARFAEHSINWRELHVAVKALATWAPSWVGAVVVFHIDNQATCGLLSKLYTPCIDLMELVRAWALLLERYGIDVRIEYINTADNVRADALSRGLIHDFLSITPHASSATWPVLVAYFNDVV